MALIDIKRAHNMSIEEVRVAAEDLVEVLEKDFGVDHAWQGENVVNFSCAPKGISGTLTVQPDQLLLKVKLGLLASMFERPLRKEIDNYLDEHLH
nr:polyhydroxyalkanoic acid system family protein [Pseudomaricurvus alcaniphilus]